MKSENSSSITKYNQTCQPLIISFRQPQKTGRLQNRGMITILTVWLLGVYPIMEVRTVWWVRPLPRNQPLMAIRAAIPSKRSMCWKNWKILLASQSLRHPSSASKSRLEGYLSMLARDWAFSLRFCSSLRYLDNVSLVQKDKLQKAKSVGYLQQSGVRYSVLSAYLLIFEEINDLACLGHPNELCRLFGSYKWWTIRRGNEILGCLVGSNWIFILLAYFVISIFLVAAFAGSLQPANFFGTDKSNAADFDGHVCRNGW